MSFANGYYTFTHQNWRDLFVAKHIINCMNSEKLDELEISVDKNVRQFVGEVIREYKDGCGYAKDYMDKSDAGKARKSECDFEEKNNLDKWFASPVEDFLQKHNLKSQSPLSAMATKNFIDVMKTSRNGNITAKYDDLNLKCTNFYKCDLENSTFNGTQIYAINFIQQGHTDSVNSVSFSPDGKKIVSGSDDETIRIWDIGTGLQICKLSTGHCVESVSFSPDGKKIVSGGWEDAIHIWDTDTGLQIGALSTGNWINSVSFSSDGKKIVSVSGNKTIRIWDAETGLQIGKLSTGDQVRSVSFSPDGKKIVSVSVDSTIRILDVETGSQICGLSTEDEVSSISFSSSGKKIVSGSSDGTIRIWDINTGAQIGKPLTGHEGSVNLVFFSPDGKRIVSGSNDKTIRIWDAVTGMQLGKPLTGHAAYDNYADYVNSVSFSPDGTKIVSGSSDGTIRIWNVETGIQIGEPLTGLTSSVRSVSFSLGGSKIVSASDDKTIRIWDVETGSQMGKPLTGHTRIVCSISFSPDGTKIVSGSHDKTIRVWDTDTGIQICEFSTEDLVESVSFSPDGNKIVSGGWGNAIHIWDTNTGLQIGELSPGGQLVSFSPDGKKIIVSGSNDGIVRIWDAETFKLVGEPYKGGTVAIFSPDGKRIAIGSYYTIKVLDAETGKPVLEDLQGNKMPVQSLAFSSDGKKIVSGSVDGTVRMWDVETGIYIGKLNVNSNIDFEEDDVIIPYIPTVGPVETVGKTESNLISSIVFSPDGKKIVSGSLDATIKIWNLESRLCTIINNKIQSYIGKCDFRNAEFNGEDESEFYGMIYSNGGIVNDESVPKPVPFEFSDKKRKEEI